MAKKPVAKKPKKVGETTETERRRAREVADRYFTFGRDDDEGDEERRRKHLDEGFEEGRPTPSRRSPHVPPSRPVPLKPLTLKQSMFVKEYLIDFNGTQAAIRAGYSEHTAHQAAYENLRKPEIKALIDREIKERAQRATWDADAVLLRLSQELTADIADLFDDNGHLLPVKQWPMIFRTGLVAGIDIEEFTNVDDMGDLVPGIVRKVKLSDRAKRIEMLGKHKAVQAWKEMKQLDIPADSPLAQLARQLEGTAIRPQLPAPEPDDAG